MKILEIDWTEFKALAQSKNLNMQYVETPSDFYDIWVVDGVDRWETRVANEGTPGMDQQDFEDNFKDTANANMQAAEDQVFNALAIRDTSDHYSSVSANIGFTPKTILIENDLNQSVTLQCEGSRYSDFSRFVEIGNGFVVTATTDDYQTATDYFPFIRIKATCSTAPTSGDLTVYIDKVK